MIKKYYSIDEFKVKNTGEKFSGYVLVDTETESATAYKTGEELSVLDNPETKVNLSDSFFDRLPKDTLKLPHGLNECTFGANEFIKSGAINRIIKNIEENSEYIFKNCYHGESDLPATNNKVFLGPIPNDIKHNLPDVYKNDDFQWIWSSRYDEIESISNAEAADYKPPYCILKSPYEPESPAYFLHQLYIEFSQSNDFSKLILSLNVPFPAPTKPTEVKYLDDKEGIYDYIKDMVNAQTGGAFTVEDAGEKEGKLAFKLSCKSISPAYFKDGGKVYVRTRYQAESTGIPPQIKTVTLETSELINESPILSDNHGHIDFNDDEIVDACVTFTDKPQANDKESYIDCMDNQEITPENRLFTVFIAYKTKIRIINIAFPSRTVLNALDENDRLDGALFNEFKYQAATRQWADIDTDIKNNFLERLSSPESYCNNFDSETTVKNLKVYEFNTVNPEKGKPDSFEFKNITGCALNGGYFYVIDSGLQGVILYDVSKCIEDRGAASNTINVIDYIHGKGTVEDAYFFDIPASITAEGDKVCILDKNNLAVKVYNAALSHNVTLCHGNFIKQEPACVAICPYDFKFNGEVVTAGSIFICSAFNDSLYLDIFGNDYTYLGNVKINDISLITEYWMDPISGAQSSPNEPIYSKEFIKKIVFSRNNSNYFYIVTDRRALKIQLSKITDVLGSISLIDKMSFIDTTFIWKSFKNKWDMTDVTDPEQFNIRWSYDKDNLVKYPNIQCFAICEVPDFINSRGVPDGNYDAIFSIFNNNRVYGSGLVQRLDSYREDVEARRLYVTESGDITYNYTKQPLYTRVGDSVLEYVSKSGVPVPTGNYVTVPPQIEEIWSTTVSGQFPKVPNAILFIKEPNNTVSSLDLNSELTAFSDDELRFDESKRQYFDAVTLNATIYKLYYNVMRLKTMITKRFVSGYNLENFLMYNGTEELFENGINDYKDFIIGENEPVSILLNRCFINIYNVQKNILKNMQVRYDGAIYKDDNYKLI